VVISLTPAHRSWRARGFAATWRSYVGFYFPVLAAAFCTALVWRNRHGKGI
jgi:hypothetical protein